jgi:hypothetical protein
MACFRCTKCTSQNRLFLVPKKSQKILVYLNCENHCKKVFNTFIEQFFAFPFRNLTKSIPSCIPGQKKILSKAKTHFSIFILINHSLYKLNPFYSRFNKFKYNKLINLSLLLLKCKAFRRNISLPYAADPVNIY